VKEKYKNLTEHERYTIYEETLRNLVNPKVGKYLLDQAIKSISQKQLNLF